MFCVWYGEHACVSVAMLPRVLFRECDSAFHRCSVTPAVQLTGEATPSYMLTYDAAEVMSYIVPGVKVLLVLRNPIERAYSA